MRAEERVALRKSTIFSATACQGKVIFVEKPCEELERTITQLGAQTSLARHNSDVFVAENPAEPGGLCTNYRSNVLVRFSKYKQKRQNIETKTLYFEIHRRLRSSGRVPPKGSRLWGVVGPANPVNPMRAPSALASRQQGLGSRLAQGRARLLRWAPSLRPCSRPKRHACVSFGLRADGAV